MARVTEDKRVQKIIARMRSGGVSDGLSERAAAAEIRALPPQTDKDGHQISQFGYLDWEIAAAIHPTI